MCWQPTGAPGRIRPTESNKSGHAKTLHKLPGSPAGNNRYGGQKRPRKQQTMTASTFLGDNSVTGMLIPAASNWQWWRCPSRMTMARPKKAIPGGAGSGDPKRFDNFSRPITACRAAISLVLGGLDLRRNIRSPGAAVIFALADMLDSGSQPFIQQVYLSSAATGLMMESRSHTNNPALPTVRIIGVRTLDELLQLVWPGLIQANHAGRLD